MSWQPPDEKGFLRPSLPRRAGRWRSAKPTRKPSSATTRRSSWRPSPSAWGSTNPMCASSCITTCPKASKATTRRSGAPGATGCRRTACCSTATAMRPNSAISSSRRRATSAAAHSSTWTRSCATPRMKSPAGANRCWLILAKPTQPRNAPPATTAPPRRPFFSDITLPAQKFLSCVKRSGERFGAGHVIDILRGSKGEKVLRLEHDKLSTYGIGADLSEKQWMGLARQLVQMGYLNQDGEYRTLSLTDKSHRRAEPAHPDQRAGAGKRTPRTPARGADARPAAGNKRRPAGAPADLGQLFQRRCRDLQVHGLFQVSLSILRHARRGPGPQQHEHHQTPSPICSMHHYRSPFVTRFVMRLSAI